MGNKEEVLKYRALTKSGKTHQASSNKLKLKDRSQIGCEKQAEKPWAQKDPPSENSYDKEQETLMVQESIIQLSSPSSEGSGINYQPGGSNQPNNKQNNPAT